MTDKVLAGGVFLTHGLLDTLVSFAGVSMYGTGLEGNPVTKWLMETHMLLFPLVKLTLVAISAVGIWYCLQWAESWGHKQYYQTATAGFILIGLLVVISNMVVIA